jgi:quercetin dioxygenase-like cupin family protein
MTQQEQPYHLIPDLAALMPEIPADSIISRVIYRDKNLNVTLFGFAAGQELTEHTATRPAVLHFLSGAAEVTLGADTVSAAPGTWIHMQPNLPQSIRAQTPVTMLLLLL